MQSPVRFAMTLILGLGAVVSCAGAPNQARRVMPIYDNFTRKLLQINADQNGDGRIDQWTYLDGNTPIRGEADADADGRVDRWEYFGADGALTMVGSASRNDGIEDTWTMTAPTTAGERHVVQSSHGDRARDRHEYFKAETLVRIEEDTDDDGVIDKWDRYEGPVLREVAFDMSFSKGRPDRRALYDAQGRFVSVEVDPDGDGTFVAAPGEPEKPRHPGAS